MNKIYEIRGLGIWIFILPILALNLCLFISTNYFLFENTIFVVDQIGRSSFTIPYIDGGVSISRTARTYPAYLVFKPCMIITAFLLIKYWNQNNSLFRTINSENKKNYLFLYFGIMSAIFLILHSIFLGINIENDLYKLFRRLVLIAFILFELIAQSLLVFTLFKIKNLISNYINKKILTLKIILVSLLVVVALISSPFLVFPGHTHFKHALEWNYFVGIVIFYLLTFLFWKNEQA